MIKIKTLANISCCLVPQTSVLNYTCQWTIYPLHASSHISYSRGKMKFLEENLRGKCNSIFAFYNFSDDSIWPTAIVGGGGGGGGRLQKIKM